MVERSKRALERAVQFLSAVAAVCAAVPDSDAIGDAVRVVLAVLLCVRCAWVVNSLLVLVTVLGVASAVHAEPAPPVSRPWPPCTMTTSPPLKR